MWRTNDKLGVAFEGEVTFHDTEIGAHETSPPLSPASAEAQKAKPADDAAAPAGDDSDFDWPS
jgi:hypothetical protein